MMYMVHVVNTTRVLQTFWRLRFEALNPQKCQVQSCHKNATFQILRCASMRHTTSCVWNKTLFCKIAMLLHNRSIHRTKMLKLPAAQMACKTARSEPHKKRAKFCSYMSREISTISSLFRPVFGVPKSATKIVIFTTFHCCATKMHTPSLRYHYTLIHHSVRIRYHCCSLHYITLT